MAVDQSLSPKGHKAVKGKTCQPCAFFRNEKTCMEQVCTAERRPDGFDVIFKRSE